METVKTYLYFPGCKIPGHLPQYDQAVRAVLSALGVGLASPEFNCCGYPVRHQSFEAAVFSSACVLAGAHRAGSPILTPCKCCYGSLKQAQYWMNENDGLRRRVEALLARQGLVWSREVEVKHLLTVLADGPLLDTIARKVTRPLKGVRVAAHYGCHALRPAGVVRFDNPLAPTLFETLVAATGATAVDWPLRLECCGAPLMEKCDAVALQLMERKLIDARQSGADLLCTACTYCQLQFDGVQHIERERSGSPDRLPAMLYPQLLGLAMGIPPSALGLERNRIPWEAALETA